MKRIITVQDISCIGKCSLTVALPVISAMGIETCVLPTAVLSNHTAFSSFSFRDLTMDIKIVIEQWKKHEMTFDAIYTGYLGSFEQIDLMNYLIDVFKCKNTFVVVDPCMADNGNLYKGFTESYASKMKELCRKADVIVPNMTEACYLLGIPYIESGYDEVYVKNILVSLSKLGAKKIVLKGIQFDDEQPDVKDVKNKLGIALYDASSESFSFYMHEKMNETFHGTGDIFASVLTGSIVREMNFTDACHLAADFVVESIRKTVKNRNHNWYGVDFESAFPYLMKRLYD